MNTLKGWRITLRLHEARQRESLFAYSARGQNRLPAKVPFVGGHTVQACDALYEQLLEIWSSRFGSEDEVWMPLVPPPVRRARLLFVGLNPAFSADGFARIFAAIGYPEIEPSQFFSWCNRSRFDPKLSQKTEVRARKTDDYFKVFGEIADKYGLRDDYEYVDLFFYRETSQKDCRDLFWKNHRPTRFGRDQLALSKALICEIDPRVIVVANAFASRIAEYEFPCKFSEKHGYHTTELTGKRIPVLLGSMLKGQGAMDRYSLHRLEWHVKHALAEIV